MTSPRTIGIAGAGLAGLALARALRSEGFDGSITLIGEEDRLPYDRPPLSKGVLAGTVADSELNLFTQSDSELELTFRLGTAVTGLDAGGRRLLVDSGPDLVVDAVGLACGSIPRELTGPMPTELPVLTLRTLADAHRLRAALVPGARLVVVGGGVVAAEVAGVAVQAGCDVTVIEGLPVPMARVLGSAIATAYAARFASRSITLLAGVGVRGVRGPLPGLAGGVEMADGRLVPADVVLVSVGARAAVDWLAGTPVAIDAGVLCGPDGATDVPSVVAVGDCARWFDPETGLRPVAQHWTRALDHAVPAARALLGLRSQVTPTAHYVWSDQLGLRLQLAGDLADLPIRIVHGPDPLDPATWAAHEVGLVAIAERDGMVAGVLAADRPRDFGRWRRQIGRPVDSNWQPAGDNRMWAAVPA